MIGFPDDTEESIHSVLRYAKKLGPTFANFNIVTPYPGTEFFEEIKSQIDTFDTTQYTVYTPVLKYRNMTSQRVTELHAQCFASYYFRSRWFIENATLLWPWLGAIVAKPAEKDRARGPIVTMARRSRIRACKSSNGPRRAHSRRPIAATRARSASE